MPYDVNLRVMEHSDDPKLNLTQTVKVPQPPQFANAVKGIRYKEGYKRQHVAAYLMLRDNMTQDEYAARHDIKIDQLRRWVKRYRILPGKASEMAKTLVSLRGVLQSLLLDIDSILPYIEVDAKQLVRAVPYKRRSRTRTVTPKRAPITPINVANAALDKPVSVNPGNRGKQGPVPNDASGDVHKRKRMFV